MSGNRPGEDDFEALARAAQANLPERFRQHLDDVVLRIEEFPSEEVMETMGLESPFDILGLYQGIDLSQKSYADSGALPDMIYLYRRPILAYCEVTGEALGDVVTHVLVHEVGHHFGLSDADMEAIEARVREGERD